MNSDSPMLLIGIGTAGSNIARGVSRAFGDGLRYVLADTDAVSGQGGGPFSLLGGDRLSGRGAGGDVVAGRLAVEDSVRGLDEHLQGVRLAVIVTALGGGTGGGGTLETAKHLGNRGVPTVVFATTPFAFEGEDRQRNARGVMAMIEEAANATFFLPLDKLIGEVTNMNEALRQAVDTVATGVTFFWRLVEKPGYIRLDTERLRHLLAGAGRGRFATTTVQGPARAKEAVDQLIRSELLATSSGPVQSPQEFLNSNNKINIINGALDTMKKKVSANYKLAIPQYYEGKIQLLLPLCLMSDNKPDVAIAVTKKNNCYQGHTCLTLDMAYNNARLIAKPESNWLSQKH